jgi:hypothetical protein
MKYAHALPLLLSLWPGAPAQTIADVTRGTDGRS